MTKLQHLRPLFLRTCQRHSQTRRFASSKDPPDDENPPKKPTTARPVYIPTPAESIDDIAEPTTCCMSGCANCVWLEYAEKLSSALKGSPGDVQKRIMDRVQDPNMRAFLSMELRVRKLID